MPPERSVAGLGFEFRSVERVHEVLRLMLDLTVAELHSAHCVPETGGIVRKVPRRERSKSSISPRATFALLASSDFYYIDLTV